MAVMKIICIAVLLACAFDIVLTNTADPTSDEPDTPQETSVDFMQLHVQ